MARQRPDEWVQRVWNAKYAGKRAGTIGRFKSGLAYRLVVVDRVLFLEHRIIWKIVTGEDPGDEIDHEDGDGLNNKWDNLRQATHAQNMHNNGGWRGRDLPKGVTRMRGRFQAQITLDYKVMALGTFDTPEEAHNAYCEAANRLHGRFASHGRPGRA